MLRFVRLLPFATAACACAAAAGTLDVHVSGIEQPRGEILIALCAASEYLVRDCTHGSLAAADANAIVVPVRDVPEGRYALLVLQDLDGDRRVKRNFIGMPLEPVAFGNDASVRFGPPTFEAAAVEVTAGHSTANVRLRYR
jgi:uncharacterized protein (DUF2141 family)